MSSEHEVEEDSRYSDKGNEDAKSEAEKEIEDVIDKVKPGGTAAVQKVIDPHKDLGTEHQRAKGTENEGKIREKEIVKSSTDVQRSRKEFVVTYAPQYRRIVVPHNGTEISDKALAHAIYLSKISKAEIVILNAVEDIHEIAPTTISAGQNSGREGSDNKSTSAENKGMGNFTNNNDAMVATAATRTATTRTISMNSKELNVTIEGHLTEMIKERIALCKEAGVEAHISYMIQTGSVVDRIVNSAKEVNADLIIMVSDKIGSSIKGIMSSTRKVIDAVEIPVLVLNK
ncbi:MAG: universal stress protein [Nitrososphaeraceae archaeon]